MYSITQAPFLEQLSDQEFWHYAQSLATQQPAPPTIAIEEALECQTEHGRYLLPLRALRGVVLPPHKLTLLPLCPPWMPGITAWRDHVVPIVDLAAYFIAHKTDALAAIPYAYPLSHSTLLILGEGNIMLGIQVALVGSIVILEQTQLASSAEAALWYPQHLLTAHLGVYNGSLLLNPQVLIDGIIQHMKVSIADE